MLLDQIYALAGAVEDLARKQGKDKRPAMADETMNKRNESEQSSSTEMEFYASVAVEITVLTAMMNQKN